MNRFLIAVWLVFPGLFAQGAFSGKQFAALEKKAVIPLVSGLGFVVGPLALIGDNLYFSRRTVGVEPCQGRELYVVDRRKPGAPKKITENACILDVLELPEHQVGIRVFDQQIKTLIYSNDKWESVDSSNLVTEEIGANLELCLFELGSDFEKVSFSEWIPYHQLNWSLAWSASPDAKKRAACTYDPIRQKYYSRSIQDFPAHSRAKTVLSSEADFAFVPSTPQGREGHFETFYSIPLRNSDPVMLWGAEVDVSSDQEVDGAAWSARQISLAQPSMTDAGLWILDDSHDSGSKSKLWFHDPVKRTFTPTMGLVTEDISWLRSVSNGLIVGRKSGRIDLVVPPEGDRTQPKLEGNGCKYQFTALETSRGRRWLFAWLRDDANSPAPSFVSLLETEPSVTSVCFGERIALLSRNYRVHWMKDHVDFKLTADRLGSDLQTNVPKVLQWSTKIATERLALSSQDVKENESPLTLFVFDKNKLTKVRVGFKGTRFVGIGKHPQDPTRVTITAESLDGMPRRYHYSMLPDGSDMKGEQR